MFSTETFRVLFGARATKAARKKKDEATRRQLRAIPPNAADLGDVPATTRATKAARRLKLPLSEANLRSTSSVRPSDVLVVVARALESFSVSFSLLSARLGLVEAAANKRD